jgi:hypothetical protein
MPEIEATVLISSCAAATFAPSNSSSGTSSGEPARLYLERESYSGTVLGAVVESAHLTGDRSRGYRSAMAGTWRKGASETLFVPRPVDAVCPDKLPVELTVQTARACCDELPLRGQCLVPDTIIPVTIIPRSRP